tara:strand:- start:4711 stop:6150 length:1440 start_codon:yes stop_codon:yes gene_type:complete
MNLTLRMFLGYFLIVCSAAFLFFNSFLGQLQTGVSQAMEETLVDTANLLAELVSRELSTDRLQDGDFTESFRAYAERKLNADIYKVAKVHGNLRVYVTDDVGTVIYDSSGLAMGQDFSRWNDVYLTLRGEYGARASRSDPDDQTTEVMYVAAPLLLDAGIAGVLTVAKPTVSLQPYTENIREDVIRNGLLLLLLALLFCLILSYWLTGSIRKLSSYADQVSVTGRRASLPAMREPELSRLGTAMASMRERLDGKTYVEEYIHSLTHEIKAPVAAIKGAVEVIDPDMGPADRQRFLDNIYHESQRLEDIASRLLELADLENRQHLEDPEVVDLTNVVREVVASREGVIAERALQVIVDLPDSAEVLGDRFLLVHAVENLLDNACRFSPLKGKVTLMVRCNDTVVVYVRDEGPGIPEFALARIYERFFSLPEPGSQLKSSGLGLNFVRQIAELHHGTIAITNGTIGAVAELSLPAGVLTRD